MRKKLHDEQIKKLVILTLIIFSFIVGFCLGALVGVKSTVNNLLEFFEDSEVDVDITINETRMIDHLYQKAKADPDFNSGGVV